MNQNIMWKDGFAIFKVKVTKKAYIIRYDYFCYNLNPVNCWSFWYQMALEAVKKESELPVDFDYQYMVPAIQKLKILVPVLSQPVPSTLPRPNNGRNIEETLTLESLVSQCDHYFCRLCCARVEIGVVNRNFILNRGRSVASVMGGGSLGTLLQKPVWSIGQRCEKPVGHLKLHLYECSLILFL